MKVIVSGDRHWSDAKFIYYVLDLIEEAYGTLEIVEGCAQGADYYAERWAIMRGRTVYHHPANWSQYGRAAGPIRNSEMLKEENPEFVIAFHSNIMNSKGTRDMVTRARKNDVATVVLNGKEFNESNRYRTWEPTKPSDEG